MTISSHTVLWGVCVHACVPAYECVCNIYLGRCSLTGIQPGFWVEASPWDLELSDSARLVGYHAPGSLLSPLPQNWDYNHDYVPRSLLTELFPSLVSYILTFKLLNKRSSIKSHKIEANYTGPDALRKLNQEDCYEFGVSLGYMVSSRPVGDTVWYTNKKEIKRQME